MQPDGTTRRAVIIGVGAAGAAAALAGCGDGAAGNEPAATGPVVVKTGEVPVGSGVIAGKVVITQLKAGEFKGLSAVCTHQGCGMAEIDDAKGTVRCGCHDSRFKLSDGSVVNGPATEPLPAVALKVTGDRITLA